MRMEFDVERSTELQLFSVFVTGFIAISSFTASCEIGLSCYALPCAHFSSLSFACGSGALLNMKSLQYVLYLTCSLKTKCYVEEQERVAETWHSVLL